LLGLLQERAAYDAKALAVALNTSQRTVYRMLQVLGLAGISCVYEAERGGYVLLGDYSFAVTALTEDELLGQATAAVLTSAKGLDIGKGAEPTTRKIKATGRDANRKLLEDARRVTAVLDLKLADHDGHREIIRTIQLALIQNRFLEGTYASPYQSTEKELFLHPIRLCLVKQAWYLIAQPEGSDHPFTYRAARFQSLKKLDVRANVPDEFDLRAYFGNAWAVYRGEPSYEVELRFMPHAAAVVTETKWHQTQRVRRNDGGSVTLSFLVDGLEEIVWWVLGLSGVVEVIRPDELRALVVDKVRSALSLNHWGG
jgi:predicted DNA-binding transcriptional regulator YafY